MSDRLAILPRRIESDPGNRFQDVYPNRLNPNLNDGISVAKVCRSMAVERSPELRKGGIDTFAIYLGRFYPKINVFGVTRSAVEYDRIPAYHHISDTMLGEHAERRDVIRI